MILAAVINGERPLENNFKLDRKSETGIRSYSGHPGTVSALPSTATTTSKPRALTSNWPRGMFSKFSEPSTSSRNFELISWKLAFVSRLWNGYRYKGRKVSQLNLPITDGINERTLGQFATSSARVRSSASCRLSRSKRLFAELASRPSIVLWATSRISW